MLSRNILSSLFEDLYSFSGPGEGSITSFGLDDSAAIDFNLSKLGEFLIFFLSSSEIRMEDNFFFVGVSVIFLWSCSGGLLRMNDSTSLSAGGRGRVASFLRRRFNQRKCLPKPSPNLFLSHPHPTPEISRIASTPS